MCNTMCSTAAALAASEARVRELEYLLCLADEALMEAHGGFPSRVNPLYDFARAIRAVTGDDYQERRRRAAVAIARFRAALSEAPRHGE